jgi:hypothetical protein
MRSIHAYPPLNAKAFMRHEQSNDVFKKTKRSDKRKPQGGLSRLHQLLKSGQIRKV